MAAIEYKVHGRQWMLYAVADVLYGNVNNVDTFVIILPPNSLLDNLTVDTTTAVATATTATLTITDGTTTYVNAVDLKSAGRETVANIGAFFPNGATLTVTTATTGSAATAGESIVAAGYVVVGRSNETQSQ